MTAPMSPARVITTAGQSAVGGSTATPTGVRASAAEPPPSGITAVDPLAGVTGPQANVPLVTGLDLLFSENARVSANAASLTRPQVEPYVASNPSSRNVMIAGYADYVADVIPGVSRSTDGGKSWGAPTGGALLPNPPGLIWGDRASVGHVAGGDPGLAWGTGDTAYYSTLGFQDGSHPPATGVCNVGGLYVYRSTDGGNTWSLPAGGAAVPNTQTVFRDKDFIAVDSNPLSSHAGTVYLVWDDDEYSGCPRDFGTNFVTRRIMFSRSTDAGVSWSTPASLATGCLVSPIPAVGTDGSLYVSWFDCNSGDRELVRKSTDGGVTFSAAVAAGSGLVRCPNPYVGASFRNGSASFPTIATDPTNASRVYIAWSSCTALAQADVFLSRSTDGGATWSPTAVRVNDDGAANPRDQFFPAVTVDDAGVIRAMWGDDRLDLTNAGGHDYDIFSADSADHGASFGTNVRVTTQSSNPDIGGTFIGDYFGIAPCGTPVWTDTRNGNLDIFGAAKDDAAAICPITKTNQTITFGTLAGKTYGDSDFTVSATASSGLTVTFTASGSCTVSGTSVHITSVGSCTITAFQAGDSSYAAAPAVARTFSIANATQTITFGTLAGKTYGDSDFTVSATASSGLTVTFTASGSCTASSGTVHLTSPGFCTVTASQPGDSNYNAATSVSQTFSIARAIQLVPPKRCTVPKVVGKRLGAAKVTIKHRHCRTGKVRYANSQKRKKGIVISQSRRPGKVAPANAKIDLVVSRGRR
jgi:PASTA domain